MKKYKVKDTYAVNEFRGLIGIYICTNELSGSLGLDFGKEITTYTHTLGDHLPKPTGRWFRLEDLEEVVEEVAGFNTRKITSSAVGAKLSFTLMVGDRVKCIKRYGTANVLGKIGTVVGFQMGYAGIEFDEYVGGHCSPVGARSKFGHGWNIPMEGEYLEIFAIGIEPPKPVVESKTKNMDRYDNIYDVSVGDVVYVYGDRGRVAFVEYYNYTVDVDFDNGDNETYHYEELSIGMDSVPVSEEDPMDFSAAEKAFMSYKSLDEVEKAYSEKTSSVPDCTPVRRVRGFMEPSRRSIIPTRG